MNRDTRPSRSTRGLLPACLVTAACAMAGSPAQADISFVDMFRNNGYTQTGDGNSLSSTGAFLALELTSTTSNEFTSVTASYPGPGSPVSLAPTTDPTFYRFQTTVLPNQAAMDAAFPAGTYTFSAMNGSGTTTTTLDYTKDDYSGSNPYLTGTDYSSLQGLNVGNAFTFHLSPFDAGSQATHSYIFLTVFDQTAGAVAFSAGFLPPSQTDVTMSANTLIAGHSYTYELDYSNRDIAGSTPPGADFAPELGFDIRTDGSFATAVPEPTSMALLAQAAGLGWFAWRRKRTRRTATAG